MRRLPKTGITLEGLTGQVADQGRRPNVLKRSGFYAFDCRAVMSRDDHLCFVGDRLSAHVHRRPPLGPSVGEHVQRGATRPSPRSEARPTGASA
jgi:hypothetical protein